MQKLIARVESVHTGQGEGLGKSARPSIQVKLDGIVDDRHRAYQRRAFKADKQPEGTLRRNERQWSAVSAEELIEIGRALDLVEPLNAGRLGANLCISGLPQLSRLPKGSLLRFPSGAELLVEEYNPPCLDMSRIIASAHTTRSGAALLPTAFAKAAARLRGIVGVVDVAGSIHPGDNVEVEIYTSPAWLAWNGH